MKETSFYTLPADKKVADVWIKVITTTLTLKENRNIIYTFDIS